MDLISLVKNLPIDLVYIVTNYDPLVLFCILGEGELINYDWFRLIKMNFSLCYSREFIMNRDMMRVYLDYCDSAKSKVTCGGIIRLLSWRMGR
ncbi:MAG: hypothetical protein Hyperionvirus2_63 [Hyperionvirus sp.]|uniref:Uncharacterized protein n=1 Tax=Hyperionvirus sp. TaxID=2487770 RepID=A0A3G5A619_9VIRU|nr:MAG: hypothetical protein Hyperionvirus2_63 [Hyperionvirus sp.]